jgi:hypothetical protein
MINQINGGTLYYRDNDRDFVKLADCLSGSLSCELSASAESALRCNIGAKASLTMDTTFITKEMLEDMWHPTGFVMQYYVPIMVQARWHKKKRINKKWLKRYGMKPDKVLVKMDANVVEYDTSDNTFEFNTKKYTYVWRPDQLRRGLKIEW